MSFWQHHHGAVHAKCSLHDSLHDDGNMPKMQVRQPVAQITVPIAV